jgi:hypothetical protein
MGSLPDKQFHMFMFIFFREESVPRLHCLSLLTSAALLQAGDFERSDEVHERLDRHDATVDFTKPRVVRSKEEMAAESAVLRQLFESESGP